MGVGMETDSPWEEDPQVDHIPDAEWTKMTTEFTNSGYREGIIAGKEAFLQVGFDAGFANVGVPLGQEIGRLRGTVAAIGSFLKAQKPDSLELKELQSVSSVLSTIQFSDIVPCDLEAEQHAKEHFDLDSAENIESITVPQERPTMEDVAKLKERLAVLITKLGLPVLA